MFFSFHAVSEAPIQPPTAPSQESSNSNGEVYCSCVIMRPISLYLYTVSALAEHHTRTLVDRLPCKVSAWIWNNMPSTLETYHMYISLFWTQQPNQEKFYTLYTKYCCRTHNHSRYSHRVFYLTHLCMASHPIWQRQHLASLECSDW